MVARATCQSALEKEWKRTTKIILGVQKNEIKRWSELSLSRLPDSIAGFRASGAMVKATGSRWRGQGFESGQVKHLFDFSDPRNINHGFSGFLPSVAVSRAEQDVERSHRTYIYLLKKNKKKRQTTSNQLLDTNQHLPVWCLADQSTYNEWQTNATASEILKREFWKWKKVLKKILFPNRKNFITLSSTVICVGATVRSWIALVVTGCLPFFFIFF